MWTRLAFCTQDNRSAETEILTAPESFTVWRTDAAKNLQDQPALAKLVDHYDQLHRLAKLVLMKMPDGMAASARDYDSVAVKYQDLMTGLRRIERALAAADSGLDQLTGLHSRIGMRDELARELNRFHRSGKIFCLALMDIDHFKKINDTYGHENGDRVLSSVANYISRHLRSFDDAWRWGGEEFLLCLKEVDAVTGRLALERLRVALEKMTIKLSTGQEINVTASFGFSVAAKEKNIDDMTNEADKALYRAKAGGRNRIEGA